MEGKDKQLSIFAQKKDEKEKVTAARLENLKERQKGKCYYSGRPITLENVSLDHKQPLSRGGKHVMSNVALTTKTINRMKASMTESEFVMLCVEIASFVPEA